MEKQNGCRKAIRRSYDYLSHFCLFLASISGLFDVVILCLESQAIMHKFRDALA